MPVQQSRAIVAPKGTPPEVLDELRAAVPEGVRGRGLPGVQHRAAAHPERGGRRGAAAAVDRRAGELPRHGRAVRHQARRRPVSSAGNDADREPGRPTAGADPPAGAVPSDVTGLAEAVHELEEAEHDRPPPAGPVTNVVTAVVVVVLGVAAVVGSLGLGVGTPGEPGPGTWPLLVSVVAGASWAIALVVLARHAHRRRAVHPRELAGAGRAGHDGRLRRGHPVHRVRDPGRAAGLRVAALPGPRGLAHCRSSSASPSSSRST